MKVLVTGGAGFIGSHVVDTFVRAQHSVVVLDNLSRGNLDNIGESLATGRCEFVHADVTSSEIVGLAALARPDVICHLAAQIDVRRSVEDPASDVATNVLGTLNVLEAARLCNAKIVFTSSGGAIYGETHGRAANEAWPLEPSSPYGASKVAGEMYCRAYRDSHGVDFTVVAPANVYGPRQDPKGEAGVVSLFGSALLSGEQGVIFGDGSATRDYVYVGDVADAFYRALTRGSGLRFNIGTGVPTSTRALHTLIAGATGRMDRPSFAPARAGELATSLLDASHAQSILGWRPTMPLAQGIASTLAWLNGTLVTASRDGGRNPARGAAVLPPRRAP